MSKIAIFPGSFDPITIGHVDIVLRALPLFDKIIVAIGNNSSKNYLYSLDKRIDFLKEVFKGYDKIETGHYEGLTINYCKQMNAKYILRGIRNASDFEYEKTIAHLNNAMEEDVETVLILSKAELSSISSTIVREIIKGKGKVDKFVPKQIVNNIQL
jgi:pantetheine-phosphate adenylyltransferase